MVGSTVTNYVWEGSQVAGEYDGATGGVQYNYVYSGSRLLSKIGFGVVNWIVSDRLSTRLVLDGSGSVIGRQGHLPFGEDFGESGSQEKHHFTSYERDTLDYAVNRYYSASVSRFLSVDPVFDGSRRASPRGCDRQSTSQTLGGYSYSLNDPENRTDRRGLWPCGRALFGGFLWSALSFDLLSRIDPLVDFLACNPIVLLPPAELFESDECSCEGTTDCSVYNDLCQDAKKDKLKPAAIAYYCEAAPRVCNGAPKEGFGSCTSNCVRKCLQEKEKQMFASYWAA